MEPASEAAFETSPAHTRLVLALLFLVAVVALVDRFAFGMLIPALAAEFHVSDKALGFVGGLAFSAFYATACLPIAHLADRVARRSVIAIGLALWSALTFASGLATSFPQLVLARFAIGVGEAAGTPPSHALISDYFPPARRGGALAVYTVGSNAGIFLAYLDGGYLLAHHGWRAVFFALGAPGLALALVIRCVVREPPRGRFDAARAEQPPMRAALAELLRQPTYRHVVAAFCLHSLAYTTASIWNPAFLERVHHLGHAEIGRVLALGLALSTGIGALACGVLTNLAVARDVRRSLWLAGAATLLAAPLTIGFVRAPNPRAAFAFLVPAAFVTGFVPGMHAVAQNLARPATRATAASFNLMLLTLAGGVGPFLAGWTNDALTSRLGPLAIRISLTGAAAVFAWSAIHIAIASRTLRADLARAGGA
jgi:predicted MFS family arabinose efflux permease